MTLYLHNMTYWMQHLYDMGFGPYVTILGTGIFWAIMFTVIGGYIYMKQQSVVAWAIGMLILIAAFGNTLIGVDPWISAMQIFVALALMGLFLVFITKYRR